MAKRRALGEGSLFRRSSDGFWVAAVTDPATGRQVRRYRKTQAEAVEALRQLQDRIRTGQPARDQAYSFQQAAHQWTTHALPLAPLKQSTADTYAYALEHWITPAIGDRKLSKLTRQHIEQMLIQLRSQGLSGSTLQTVLSVTRTVLKYAQASRWIAHNPAQGIPKPAATPVREKHVPTPAETQALLAAATSPALRISIALCAFTGLRIGEALALTWSDVDTSRRLLTVNGTAYRPRKKGSPITTQAPKTTSSQRTIPIPAGLADELKRWRETQAAPRITGPVICGDYGQPREYSSLARELRELVATLQLPPVTFHSWRHATATLMMEAGTPDRIVADLLGHSSVLVTRRIYQHSREHVSRAALEAMSTALTTALDNTDSSEAQ